jgi:zinc transporter ZupT
VTRWRAVLELVLASVAAIGAVVSWLAAQSSATNPPIADGEPATTTVTYYPPLLVLTFVLGTAAGVLVVLGAARWRRASSRKPSQNCIPGRENRDAATLDAISRDGTGG